jgi:hypothetical protein
MRDIVFNATIALLILALQVFFWWPLLVYAWHYWLG